MSGTFSTHLPPCVFSRTCALYLCWPPVKVMAMKENSWSPSAGTSPALELLTAEEMRREEPEKEMLMGLVGW